VGKHIGLKELSDCSVTNSAMLH